MTDHDLISNIHRRMDVCNVQAFALLSEVQAGNATMPSIEAFIASLPEFSL